MTSPTVPLPPKGWEAAAMQPNRKTASQCGKPFFYWTDSQQNDAGVMAGLDGLVVPGGYLDLSNVGLAQQEHGQTGLADAAADGAGAARPSSSSLWKGSSAAVCRSRRVSSWRSRASASTRMPMEESSRARSSSVVPDENVPVEGPVVVVRGAAVVGLAGLQRAADAA